MNKAEREFRAMLYLSRVNPRRYRLTRFYGRNQIYIHYRLYDYGHDGDLYGRLRPHIASVEYDTTTKRFSGCIL